MFENLKVSLFLALRELQRGSKGGLIANVAIISLVFVNMILMTSIITGSVHLFNEQTVDYQTSDIIIKPEKDDQMYINDVDSLLSIVNRVPGVVRGSARYSLGGTLNYKGKSVSMPVVAFEPSDEIQVTKIYTKMKSGEFLTDGDTDEIMLGGFVAGNKDESMDLFDSLGGIEVGDSVEVLFSNGVSKEYRVKGITQTKSYLVDYMVFINWDEMDSVLGYKNNEATEVLVKTVNPDDVDKVRINLMSYGVQEEVETWEQGTSKMIEDAIENFTIINDITMLVSIIIAVVVLFIVIMIKAINSRRQIGIQKAIGIERSIIINSYVLQVLFICTIGIILGLIAIMLMVIYFTAHPLEFPDGDVVPVVEWTLLVRNTIYLYIASAFAGYIPAWRITGENILDAMRS